MTSCGREVFDFDLEANKAVVARPLQYMVGCTSSELWCTYDAITFPSAQIVKDFIKEKKILLTAKRQLEEKIKQKIAQEAV